MSTVIRGSATGDSQTSRRISEAILTGCLPVFPGAPYHTMPFADVVDYRDFSLFFDIQDNARWAANTTLHELVRLPGPVFSTPLSLPTNLMAPSCSITLQLLYSWCVIQYIKNFCIPAAGGHG